MSWKQPIPTDIYDIFGDDHLARDLYIHLLLRSQNSDMEHPKHYKGKPYQLKRGQAIFGRNEYSKLLRCSGSGLRHALDRLEKRYSRVTSKPSPDHTVITILDYDFIIEMDKQKTKQRPSKGQAKDTLKSVKSDKSDKDKSEKIQITHTLQKYIAENLKEVSRIPEQITADQCEKLIAKYPEELIYEKLLLMENKYGLAKNYQSVYLTLLNWCRMAIEDGWRRKKNVNPFFGI